MHCKPTSILFTVLLSYSLFSSVPSLALGLKDPFGTQEELPQAFLKHCPTAPNKESLGLLDAINIALCNNPETRASWANAKAAAASLGQARSTYLPNLTLEGSATHFDSDSANGSNSISVNNIDSETPTDSTAGTTGTSTVTSSGNLVRGKHYESYGPGLSLNYLLYDFGGREASVDSAKQQMLQAGWAYSSQMQALIFQVIKAYTSVFTTTEAVEAARVSEKASEEAFDAAKARYDVGLVTKADSAVAETAFAQSTLTRQRAENTRAQAIGTFASLLHLSPTTPLRLRPLDPERANKPFETDAEKLMKEARIARPDLAASRAREAQAEADYRYARTRGYPSLSLVGAANQTYYTTGDDNGRYNDSIQLRLSVPLFTGFNTTYQKRRAKHLFEAATADREKAEDDAALDVWNSYHNYQTAQQAYQTASALIRSAGESQELNFGRYKAGRGTLIDALNAQAQLADARQQWVAARYDLLVTRYDLMRAMGNPGLAELHLYDPAETAEATGENLNHFAPYFGAFKPGNNKISAPGNATKSVSKPIDNHLKKP